MIDKSKCNLTQGLIFHGLRSFLYTDIACYGVVITARCDLAQRKVKQIHCVSALDIAQWIKRDCIMQIAEEIIRATIKKIKKWMLDKKLNPDLVEELGSVKCKRIIEAYKTKNDSILVDADNWFIAEEIIERRLPESQIKSLLEKDKIYITKKKEKIQNMIENKLSGYYFIGELGIGEEAKGYVINLRDIHVLKMDYVDLLLEKKIDYLNTKILDDFGIKNNFFLESKEDFALEFGIIKSPYIEHMMQNFVQLYSRIGIDDLRDGFMEEMHNQCVCII